MREVELRGKVYAGRVAINFGDLPRNNQVDRKVLVRLTYSRSVVIFDSCEIPAVFQSGSVEA